MGPATATNLGAIDAMLANGRETSTLIRAHDWSGSPIIGSLDRLTRRGPGDERERGRRSRPAAADQAIPQHRCVTLAEERTDE